jgi:hypothetical protein
LSKKEEYVKTLQAAIKKNGSLIDGNTLALGCANEESETKSVENAPQNDPHFDEDYTCLNPSV